MFFHAHGTAKLKKKRNFLNWILDKNGIWMEDSNEMVGVFEFDYMQLSSQILR